MIKIGDFANMFGVSIKTIRFYEEKKLLKPAYVDIYTGYRYFDEKNIDEMSKILTYKSLGFELSEINDIHDQTIINKIEDFKKKISTMNSQIIGLNSLLNSEEGSVEKMTTFINDEKAIGKWSLIGLAKSKEDFDKNLLLDEDIVIKDLYLMDNGTEYWVISWTKGIIYIKNKPYTYEIDGDKMFINLKGLYGEDEKIAVYKRIDNKHYTDEEIRINDDTNVPFVEDKQLNGLWNCIGYTEDKDFKDLSNIYKDGIVNRLSFFPNGEANITFSDNYSKSISYTKGFVKNFGAKNTMCAYEIKNINEKEYLIIEWKSGDYVYGGFVACYYVFEKVEI